MIFHRTDRRGEGALLILESMAERAATSLLEAERNLRNGFRLDPDAIALIIGKP